MVIIMIIRLAFYARILRNLGHLSLALQEAPNIWWIIAVAIILLLIIILFVFELSLPENPKHSRFN